MTDFSAVEGTSKTSYSQQKGITSNTDKYTTCVYIVLNNVVLSAEQD